MVYVSVIRDLTRSICHLFAMSINLIQRYVTIVWCIESAMDCFRILMKTFGITQNGRHTGAWLQNFSIQGGVGVREIMEHLSNFVAG